MNMDVASTLRQCLKYYHSNEKRIIGDVKPFTKAKLHFINSKLFEEGTVPKETMLLVISSAAKDNLKARKNS